MLLDADEAALDALAVPAHLRRAADELNDADFAAVFEWADPAIPDARIDPYGNGLSSEDLRHMFAVP